MAVVFELLATIKILLQRCFSLSRFKKWFKLIMVKCKLSRKYEIQFDITENSNITTKPIRIASRTKSMFDEIPLEMCEEILSYLINDKDAICSSIQVSKVWSYIIHDLLRRKNMAAKKMFDDETLPRQEKLKAILRCLTLSKFVDTINESKFKHSGKKECSTCFRCANKKETSDLRILISGIHNLEIKVSRLEDWKFWMQNIPKYLEKVQNLDFKLPTEFDQHRSRIIQDVTSMNDEMGIYQIVKLHFHKVPTWFGMFIPSVQVTGVIQFSIQ